MLIGLVLWTFNSYAYLQRKTAPLRTLRETCEQTEQYRYDNCNRLTNLEITPKDASKAHSSVSYQYDKQGNMLSDGNNTYSYDGFNRMAQVQTAEGRIQKNSYDAEGLRHEMEENGQLVKFLYNENREVVAEEESTGNIIRYIRGLGLISSDSENARTYYHYVSDEQGSITHMVDGENGTILNHYTYDAFGNTIHCEEQVHNRFRYNGEQYDPVTSQYYLRARFYNPAIARFTQEDTYYGDGLNLYRYCANNPVEYKDPSGHNICPRQLDLYKKYRAEGMSPRDAYDRMRTELGLSSKNPFTKDSEGGTVPVLQKQLEGKSGNPVFEISREKYPNHVKMLENAEKIGHPLKNLIRGAGTRAAQRNRYESQKEIRKLKGGPPKGYDYDEFPYASTKQGGEECLYRNCSQW